MARTAAGLLLAVAAVGMALPGLASSSVIGCASDQDCLDKGGADSWRCLKSTAPGAATCTLPANAGQGTCACTFQTCPTSAAYPPEVKAGAKQYLMLGDSISIGMHVDVFNALASHGIQGTHNLANAANTNYGTHCLDTMLNDTKRWDVISFNWGLHDMAQDEEHLLPSTYERLLRGIVAKLVATGAKLLWVSTTPVPSVPVHPPRDNADVVALNRIAAGIMQENSIPTVDMYDWVLAKCGPVPYKSCSIQLPNNVHYTTAGWSYLASNMTAAVLQAFGE